MKKITQNHYVVNRRNSVRLLSGEVFTEKEIIRGYRECGYDDNGKMTECEIMRDAMDDGAENLIDFLNRFHSLAEIAAHNGALYAHLCHEFPKKEIERYLDIPRVITLRELVDEKIISEKTLASFGWDENEREELMDDKTILRKTKRGIEVYMSMHLQDPGWVKING